MTKKYIAKLIVVLNLLFLVSSCEGYMEEMPQNKMKPSTTEDYEQLLNRGYVSKQIMPYLDILSDDVALIASDHVMEGKDRGDPYIAAYMWDSRHDAAMSNRDEAFAAFYNSIFYANVVIFNIGDALGVELDETKVRQAKTAIKGEAMVLRAYSYFYLVNLYAKHYDPQTCANDAGIPINLDCTADDKAYPRSTVKEVYDLIISDLINGIRLMESTSIRHDNKVKMSPLAARALLARVYLYTHQWDLAIEQAKYVIKQNPAIFNLYEAGTKNAIITNKGGSWSKNTSIWGEDYLGKNNPNVIFVNGVSETIPALSFWPFITTFSVNKELAACYEKEDVRRYYFMYTYDRNTYSGFRSKLSVAKNRRGLVFEPGLSAGYSRVIRTEEMYLILAEAYAHKEDGIDDAVSYLNTLRREKFQQNKYVELTAGEFTQQTLIDFVIDERRREFCFEGHRWFDLRRTTRPAMSRVGYENAVAKLEKDDPRYILQIPEKELIANPSIGMNPR